MRHFKNWINAFVDYCQDAECPTSYLQWAAVSTIAGALQRKTFTNWGTETIYPNFYILLVGPPGRTRKSSALKPAMDLSRDLGLPKAPDATTMANLIDALEKASSVYENSEGFPVAHCSLNVFSTEFFVFLNKKEPTFIENLTDLYDCRDQWDKGTKHSGSNSIPGVFLNILGGTTPTQVQESLPTNAIGIGLTSRMIFVSESRARKRVARPNFPNTPEGMALWTKLSEDLFQIHQLKENFKITEEFYNAYIPWYENMPDSPGFPGAFRFEGYWSRRATHLKKLVMIMSAARGDDLILTKLDFDNALSMLEAIEPKMPQTFGEGGRDKSAVIIELIMTDMVSLKTTTFNNLLKTYMKETNIEELTRIIKTLERINFLTAKRTIDGDFILELVEENNEC